MNLPAESLPRWLARLRYPSGPTMRRGLVRFPRRAGDVSDDTQLTIAVARSIGDDGAYCNERFLEELAAWSRIRIGAGRASAKAAVRVRRGCARETGHPSEGNGVAIRVTPFAIAYALRGDDELSTVVSHNGRVTHTSNAAACAAAFVALLTREALVLPRGCFERDSDLSAAIRQAQAASHFEFEAPSPSAVKTNDELVRFLRSTGTSGHVYQCVPAATAILLRHRLDYRSAMRSVFRAGGDTDSIGAIVGAVIGAQVGAASLPQDWVQAVQHRDFLFVLADRLAAAAACHQSRRP